MKDAVTADPGRAAQRRNPRPPQPSAEALALFAEAEGEWGGLRLEPRLVALPPSPVMRLPPVSYIRRLNTTRLLPARYSESVLTRIAANDEDLQLIFALDNATNDRLLAEQNLKLGVSARELVYDVPNSRIINAAFTHPHPQGGRFSLPDRGAWYASFELATSKAEVLFHRMLQFEEIAWQKPEELDYDQYLADFTGSFHDLRPEAFAPAVAVASATPVPQGEDHLTIEARAETGSEAEQGAPPLVPSTAAEFADCLDPESYISSQRLTLQLLKAGSLGVLYPSARLRGGHCVACFRPGMVSNVRKRDLFRLTWYPDKAPTFVRCARTRAGSEPGPAPAESTRKSSS